MATSAFVIKCKTEKGTHTLEDLDEECTIGKLKVCLQKLTGIDPGRMKILCGYPPKPLNLNNENIKLSVVNIHSGDTIIVEKCDVAQMCNTVHEKLLGEANTAASSDQPHIKVNQAVINQPGIMMRHVVPSNNSCLFTSIYFLLSGETDVNRSKELRKIVADAVAGDSIKYNQALLQRSNAEYCQWILHLDNWGGDIELSIFSAYYELEIVAIDVVTMVAHRFGENSSYSSRIFLLYDGIHYDPLLLQLENDIQTIFLASDPKPMIMAMEVAREANSSRQFTDVANFTLMCMVCKIHLRGEAEARKHAESTGHVNFGET